MKEILAIILVLLLISVALNVYQGINAREAQQNALNQNRANQEAIANATHRAEMAGARADSIEAKRIRDSVSYKVSLIARNDEIRAYKKTIIRLRPLVAAKIDSFPDLREFVAAQDSTISHQDSLLRDTEIFCQLQVQDLQAIIQLQNEKYTAQEAISQAWMETAAEAQKQVRKEKRKGKFKNVVIGVLGATVIYLSVKP